MNNVGALYRTLRNSETPAKPGMNIAPGWFAPDLRIRWRTCASVIALAVCLVVAPADAFVARHVYVAVDVFQFGVPQDVRILRYPITGWRIARKPDHTYTGYSGPLAFDDSGIMFAGNGGFGAGATSQLSGFRAGSAKPFRVYPVPIQSSGGVSLATAAAVDKHDLLAIGYVYYATPSSTPVTSLAILRITDGRVLSVTMLGDGARISGMAFDNNDELFVSYGSDVLVYNGVNGPRLSPDGVISSPGLRAPAGLSVTSSGQLYALSVPSIGKPSVFSFSDIARGDVSPIREVTPLGPDDATACCSISGSPFPLPSTAATFTDRLLMPFFAVSHSGAQYAGVYEFSRFESGVARAIEALPVAQAAKNQYPYVIEAAVLGP